MLNDERLKKVQGGVMVPGYGTHMFEKDENGDHELTTVAPRVAWSGSTKIGDPQDAVHELSSTYPVRSAVGSQAPMSASRSHSAVEFTESAWLGILLKSHVWTAGGQATLALLSAEVLSYEHGAIAASLIFVLSLFVYNLDHLVDTRSNGQSERRARRSMGLLFATVGGAGSLGIVFLLPIQALSVLALPFTIGILYSLPLWPLSGSGRWRLRDLPLLKTPLVAGSVVWCAVLLPMALDDAIPDLTAIFLAGYLFVFAFSNCAISDLRDIEDDRSTRTLTFPALFGERGCRRLLIGMNILTLCMLPCWLPPGPALHIALVGATVGTLCYVIYLKNSSSSREFALLVDGCPYILLISMLS